MQVYVYRGARGGRLIADVVRLDKGHAEGLEPHVTEKLVTVMTDAPGGKLRASLMLPVGSGTGRVRRRVPGGGYWPLDLAGTRMLSNGSPELECRRSR